MYNSDTDLLFPPRIIPTIRNLRGESWGDLVDTILEREPADPERLAFVLLMIRLMGCTSCQADSFRALRGCTACASQTVRRYRGSDADLMRMYSEARLEIDKYMGKEEESGADLKGSTQEG
ncbi:MAG: hypothetical protein ACM3PY_01785 [Omnitrophica WOR_2 bacterium]